MLVTELRARVYTCTCVCVCVCTGVFESVCSSAASRRRELSPREAFDEQRQAVSKSRGKSDRIGCVQTFKYRNVEERSLFFVIYSLARDVKTWLGKSDSTRDGAKLRGERLIKYTPRCCWNL